MEVKKDYVELYYKFHYQTEIEGETTETTINAFLVEFYKGNPDLTKDKIDFKTLYKWIKSDQRLEFEEWDGENSLTKQNCKSKRIMELINSALSVTNPEAAKWNELTKSTSSSEQYTIVARQRIPEGTSLGFFKGNLVPSITNGPRKRFFGLKRSLQVMSGDEMEGAGELETETEILHIDGSAYDSCYAKYYACPTNYTCVTKTKEVTNVSVERAEVWTDHNKAISFVASCDIEKGQELLIPAEQDYDRRMGNNTKRVKLAKYGR